MKVHGNRPIHWKENIKERHLSVHRNFFCSGIHVLLILFGWLVRWGLYSRKANVFWGIASKFFLKQHVEFLCSSHLPLSSYLSFSSRWCFHPVVLLQSQLGRKPVSFYQMSDLYMSGNLPKAIHVFSMRMVKTLFVHEILLPNYVNHIQAIIFQFIQSAEFKICRVYPLLRVKSFCKRRCPEYNKNTFSGDGLVLVLLVEAWSYS